MGAGDAISEGKKALELTATKANKNIINISRGLIYWRKKFIIIISLKNDLNLLR
jgi:hypothetical protein